MTDAPPASDSAAEEDDGELLEAYMDSDKGVVKDRWGDPLTGSVWYILSGKWLKQWKIYKEKVDLTGENVDRRAPGPVDNSDILMDPGTYYTTEEGTQYDRMLKAGISLNVDYAILPPAAWELLKRKYGVLTGSEIPRFSIQQTAVRTFVELVLREFRLVVVLPDYTVVDPKPLFVSRKQKVRELTARIAKVAAPLTALKTLFPGDLTLWELDYSSGLDTLRERITHREAGKVVELLGKRLVSQEETMDEADIPMFAIIVAEVRLPDSNWLFSREVNQFRCEGCRKISFGVPLKCECGKSRDRSFHQCRTYQLRNPVVENRSLARAANSKMGICGLQNLGNTCFMNSGLQCLSNTFALTDIFLSDQYEADLNPTNTIGTSCKLVKAYAALVKEMWYGTNSSVSPWYFKRELGDFVPQFYGYSQQDSHELVNYVLDLLHEDLNRVKIKPVPEEVKQEGLSEEAVSNLFWQNHISRNQSFVVDLMHGQYRSEVTCPKCSKSSLAFDPFLSLSVSFPKKDVKSMDLVCVFGEIGRPVTRIKVQLPRKGTISAVKAETGRLFSINPDHLQAAKVYSYSATEFFPDDLDLSQVPSTSTLVMYEVPHIESKLPVILNFFKDPESQYYSKTSFAYSRVIMVDSRFTSSQVHLKVYQYLTRARTSRRVDLQDAEMTDDETGELGALEEAYHRDMTGKDYSKHFKINMVNLQREKAQGGSTYYYSSYYSGPQCDYCERKECRNCPLPDSSDTNFSDIVGKNRSGRPFRLEIVVPYQGVDQLKVLTETFIHESVNKFHEDQRKLTEMQYSLEECIEFSSQAETLDEQNEVFCSTCKEHVQASKQMTIFRLPKILIIHLKRFKEKGYHKDKDGRLISFPVEGLDMTRFCHISSGPPMYDLYAVSNHFGGLGGGHYTAYAKNQENGRWYNFDDSSVREVGSAGSVVSPAAYVLFYKARDEPTAQS